MIDNNKIKLKVKELFFKEFENEIAQINDYKKILDIESKNREAIKFSSKTYKEKLDSILNKLEKELELHKNSDEYIILEQYTVVDKNLLEICNQFKYKDLAIIYIQYLSLKNKSNANTLNNYKWFIPKYYIPYEWTCSYCNTKNIFKSTTKSQKNINELKCQNCELKLSEYGNSKFKKHFFKVLSIQEIRIKIKNIENEFSKLVFLNEKANDTITWSENDKYMVYENNKNKLTYKIRKALENFHNLPEKISLEKDFNVVFDSNDRELSKYGLIKINERKLTEFELAEKYLNNRPWFSFELIYENYDKYYRYDLTLVSLKEFLEGDEDSIMNFRLINFDKLDYYDDSKNSIKDGILINEFFFNKDYYKKVTLLDKNKINIFQSENQKELYAKLRKRYKNEYTILPNYPIVKLINFQTEKLVKTFSKEDSLYLQKAFFSFVIINEKGDVIKIYNIANTYYHTKKEYEHKDNLKKEFCTFFDVFFEEII